MSYKWVSLPRVASRIPWNIFRAPIGQDKPPIWQFLDWRLLLGRFSPLWSWNRVCFSCRLSVSLEDAKQWKLESEIGIRFVIYYLLEKSYRIVIFLRGGFGWQFVTCCLKSEKKIVWSRFYLRYAESVRNKNMERKINCMLYVSNNTCVYHTFLG